MNERYCDQKKENDFRDSNKPLTRLSLCKKNKSNVVLFGAPTSTAAKYEERQKEDENITCEILEEIGKSSLKNGFY